VKQSYEIRNEIRTNKDRINYEIEEFMWKVKKRRE
jgi:hypothetical protein